MRKLQNDGISTAEEGVLDDDFDLLKTGPDDDKLDIESFSDEGEVEEF